MYNEHSYRPVKSKIVRPNLENLEIEKLSRKLIRNSTKHSSVPFNEKKWLIYFFQIQNLIKKLLLIIHYSIAQSCYLEARRKILVFR